MNILTWVISQLFFMELFGIALFPGHHVYPGAAGIQEWPGPSKNWSANNGQAVTWVVGDNSWRVSGILTVEAFEAREKGREPKRIPVVPSSANNPYLLDRWATLRNILRFN
jgi:hypothetical protein